jgi:hypothetical protein
VAISTVLSHQEEEDEASGRAAMTLPKKYDCCPSPEQVNSKMAGGNRDGENQRAAEYEYVVVRE